MASKWLCTNCGDQPTGPQCSNCGDPAPKGWRLKVDESGPHGELEMDEQGMWVPKS